MNQKKVSVIICCYNSRSRIKPTLDHLALQEGLDTENWELILVDNNSTDDTSTIVEEHWSRIGCEVDLTITKEPLPGLSNARKQGIAMSKGVYVLFCDDDNWLDRTYLATAVSKMDENPSIGVMGGIGLPVLEGTEPYWFQQYKWSYAVGPQAEVSGDITFSKGYVYGAGSVMKKAVLDELYDLGFVHFLPDRRANVIISGGDNELCYNVAFLGYKIHYSDELKFWHYIPSSRLNLDYLKKFRIGQARSYDLIKSYETILFSKGETRRNSKQRVKEFLEYGKMIRILLKEKKKNEVDKARFIFTYYNLVNILKLGILHWRENLQKEKEIFRFFERSTQSKNKDF